jgi:WD40 repeat protein
MSFSPGAQDSTLSIFELVTGDLHRILIGHAGPVLCVAVTADNTAVLTGSEDNTVKVSLCPFLPPSSVCSRVM